MSIVKKEAFFESSTGFNDIHTLIWQDSTQTPIGILQIAHGIAEHIDRYDAFAKYMAKHGFIVCGNDHIGHGKSVSLEDLGYTTEQDGHIRMVDDMHILTQIMKKKYPDLPYILLGHSMGSFAARNYITLFGDDIQAVILVGTGDMPNEIKMLDAALDTLLNRNKDGKTLLPKLTKAFNTFTNRQFAKTTRNTGLEWLSTEDKVINEYIADPLSGFTFRISLVRDLVNMAGTAGAKDWSAKVPADLPIMLISGAEDPIGANGEGVMKVADELVMTGHNPELILYPDERHEILNGETHERIWQDVAEWATSTIS